VIDLAEVATAYRELHDLADCDADLVEMRPAAAELHRVAHELAAGQRPLFWPARELRVERIPSREAATRIMAIISKIPGPTGGEDEALRKALAHLGAGLVHTIMHVIFRDYPELVPHEPAG
jgi:hypothetical protein